MKKLNYNKGITLIALVITIIVMLILVTVTINIAVNGRLFDYAKMAVSEEKIAKYKEAISLAQLQAQYLSNSDSSVLERIRNILSQENLFKDATFGDVSGGQFIITTKENMVFTVTTNDILYGTNLVYAKACETPNFFGDQQTSQEVIVYKSTEYSDFLDYIVSSLNNEERESLYCVAYLFQNGFTIIENEMKNNNFNHSNISKEAVYQICTNNYNNTNVGSFFSAVYIDKISLDDTKTNLLAMWNSKNSTSFTSVDQVLSAVIGEATTVEAKTVEYHCSEKVLIDLLYTLLIQNNQVDFSSGLAILYASFQETWNSFLATTKLGSDYVVVVPGNIEKSGSDVVNFIVNNNGTYTYQVKHNGETTEGSIDIASIAQDVITYEYIDTDEHIVYIQYADGGENDYDELHTWVQVEENLWRCVCGLEYSRIMQNDESNHWMQKVFSNGAQIMEEINPHEFDSEDRPRTCTVCGYSE